jgi:hypothetical protein
MVRKARAGHVTGGRVFGYDNAEILELLRGRVTMTPEVRH